MFLVSLVILAMWATLLDWLGKISWNNLVILAKWQAFCIKALVGYAMQLTKGRCALKVETACI